MVGMDMTMVTRAKVFMMLFWLLEMIGAKGLCHRMQDVSINVPPSRWPVGFQSGIFKQVFVFKVLLDIAG